MSNSRALGIDQIIVIGLMFFAFMMSALVSERVFERLPHLEDEIAYLYQAKIFAHGDLVIPSPENSRAFWQPFVIDSNETGNRFSKYPPGWSLVLGIGENFGQSWIINAFFSALNVAVIYQLGRQIFNPATGVIAAILIAFSPIALLLNATLMGHTFGLFLATLFVLALWYLEKRQQPVRWGIVSGAALGLLVLTRPLTAVGIALPFIAWVVISLGRNLVTNRLLMLQDRRVLAYGVVAGLTLFLSLGIPFYNWLATGNPAQNLYELVWTYDRIGFGEEYGRTGHSIEAGIRHARYDLSLAAADVFGWQIGQITPEDQEHLRTESDYWTGFGLGFFILPIGASIGLFMGAKNKLRRLLWLGVWLTGAIIWVFVVISVEQSTGQDPGFSWFWVIVALLWILLPLLFMFSSQLVTARWTWLLVAVILCTVVLQMAYWIGSQRYSTRYYYETMFAVTILAAVPFAWLANKWRKLPVYVLVVILMSFGLFAYSIPRISALYRFNNVGRDWLELIADMQVDGEPVLIVMIGESMSWRAMGTYMAVTSPYLDSDIVLVRIDPGENNLEDIRDMFPNRQVIQFDVTGAVAVLRGRNTNP